MAMPHYSHGSQTRTLRRTAARLADASGHAAEQFERLEQRALFAADPITNNHPVWHAPLATVPMRIDGNLTDREWAGAPSVVRTLAFNADSATTLRMKHTPQGLVLGVEIRDDWLWADGTGGGAGNRWDWHDDDSFRVFFDPVNSRRATLQSTGRVLAFNMGAFNGPANGSGRVARWEFGRGNGRGSFNAIPLPAGMRWATRVIGTVNNNADLDTGWTAEVFIPWSALGMKARPANGRVIGMNFDVLFDDNGGVRNPTETSPDTRFGDKQVNSYIEGVFSSINEGNAGFRGPLNYAYLQFTNGAVADRPAAITGLTASDVTGYGVRLNFPAPAGSLKGAGHAYGYDIRWSTSPIVTEDDWAAASVVKQNFTPHLKGQAESLRLGELTPGTTYYMAVRARDLAGRAGDFATTTFTTLSTLEDTSGGGRVMPAPTGNTLMYENGTPFIMVSSAVTVMNQYLKGLYAGAIYRPGDGAYVDHTTQPNAAEKAAQYFDALSASGVNTLRVQLEWSRLEGVNQPTDNLPYGTRWLEWREPGDIQSTFNPEMKAFLHRMMEQADRTGIRLFLQTFNNFNYESNLHLTAFSTINGGPISSFSEFYTNPEVLEMAQNRLRVLADWIRESPYSHTVFGFDLINEWEHGSNAIPEMTRRAKFMMNLADDIHAYAPELLVMDASIRVAPRGPVARVLFYSDTYDVQNPHFYYNSISQPVNIDESDRSVKPAIDMGSVVAYRMVNRRDNRPINNSEWDLWPSKWPGGEIYYTDHPEIRTPNASKPFYLAEDEALVRTISWVSIASGMAGAGLRNARISLATTWPDGTPEVFATPLSKGMRETQASVVRFVQDNTLGFDWDNFGASSLTSRIDAIGTNGDRLLAFGSATQDQGLAYILRDAHRSTGNARVDASTLRIKGLARAATYAAELWSTGANAQIISTVTATANNIGTVNFALPEFTTDVMIKFKRVA